MPFKAAAALLMLGAALASPAAAAPVESSVSAGPAGVLKGTLLQPEASKGPVAIIIPGSGPTDRNGDNPAGVRGGPLRKLAEDLAKRGVATVRIDKRGMFESAGAGDPNKVTFALYAQDVHDWAKVARARTGAPCAWVIGHSEGSLTALVAAQDATDICGLVLVSGTARKLGDLIRAQLAAHPALPPYMPAINTAIAEMEAGRRPDVSALPAPLQQGLFAPQVMDFLMDGMRQDPLALLKAYKGPVLVVHGGADLQVPPDNAELFAAARPGVEKVVLPGLNHLLKPAPMDRAANLATYADASLAPPPEAADAIARFVKAH